MIVQNETRRGFIDGDTRLLATMLMETPFAISGQPNTAEEAMAMPGCCVKSLARERIGGWPKRFGRVTEIDKQADIVIVTGAGYSESTSFVWIGTQAEYIATWECD